AHYFKMEQFKIINIPTEYKEEDEVESKDQEVLEETEYDDSDYNPPKKRWILLLLILVAGLASFYIYDALKTFNDYDLRAEYRREDSNETRYLDFNGNLLKYSTDGASCTTYKNGLIWSYSYDFTNPAMAVCKDYAVAYDKKGSEVDIFSKDGFVKSINTNMPIIKADVAAQGTVVVLMQQESTNYIQMYDTKGELLVSGQLHLENSGYPMSMALSSDGTRLLISLLCLNEGSVKSTVTFYDFSSKGKESKDNIVATYTYEDMVVPQVDFVSGDKAIAFTENKIIVYNNNLEATIAKEIELTEQLKSVFYNDKYYGFVCDKILESGEIVSELTLYNLYGFECFSTEFYSSYSDIQIMNNGEVLLLDSNKVDIYSKFGVHKFSYDFDTVVYTVVPERFLHRYKIIEETLTDEVQLK
ncbi:MAG: hypothetical protein HUJ70_11625, partial [Pseudobutyrivibrio sp.]|nr:hypothetical protein [Pseudobutyrivibrio sp.]